MKILLLILVFTFAAIGQSTTINELRAKTKAAKIDKDVIVGYDKFKDTGGVMTKPVNIGTGGGMFNVSVLVMNLAYQFKGTTIEGRPDEYVLMMTSASRDWKFLGEDRNLYFLYDGRRLELNPNDRKDRIDGSFVMEAMEYKITMADLQKLLDAKSVELKLGSMPRKLKPEVLERFRKMVALLS